MANWFINFITQFSQGLMIAGICYLIGLLAYTIYKKKQDNQQMYIEDKTTGFVKGLVKFARFVAGKLK